MLYRALLSVATCIIFNPTARGERATRLRRHLDSLRDHCSLRPTFAAGAARQLAAEAVAEGFDTVVAAGGDGTVHEVLNGIGDVDGGFERCRLGVLPLGTINVFARELNLPQDIGQAWETICRGREIPIDLPRVEFCKGGEVQRRFFAQLAGAGLDAMAVHLVSWELKKRIGSLAYVAAGLQALRAHHATISVGHDTVTAAGELVLIGNGRYYGGSWPVFHRADFQDGLLDVCVFRRINWFSITRYAWSLLAQRPILSESEQHFQCDHFRLEAPTETHLELDGEWVGSLPASFQIRSQGLRVIAGPEREGVSRASVSGN